MENLLYGMPTQGVVGMFLSEISAGIEIVIIKYLVIFYIIEGLGYAG